MSKQRLKKEESDLRKKILIKMMKQFSKGLTLPQFMRLVNERVFKENKYKVVYTTIVTIRDKYNKEHPEDEINFIDGTNVYPKDMPKLNKRAEDSELLKEQLQEYFTLFKTDKDKLIEKYNKMVQKNKPIIKPTRETYEDYKQKVIENNNKIEYIYTYINNIVNLFMDIKEIIDTNETDIVLNNNIYNEIINNLHKIVDIHLTNQFYHVIINDIWNKLKELYSNHTQFLFRDIDIIDNFITIYTKYDICNLTIEQYEELKSDIEKNNDSPDVILPIGLDGENGKYIPYLNSIIDFIKDQNLLQYIKMYNTEVIDSNEILILIDIFNNICVCINVFDVNDFSIYITYYNGFVIERFKEYDNLNILLNDLKQYILKYKDGVK
jgi:hypothetical protein